MRLLVLQALFLSFSLAAAEPPLRQPVDLLLAGDRLYSANRGSGSLSRFALSSGRVEESVLGKGLSDLVMLADGRLLALDELDGSALLIDPATLKLLQRLSLPGGPVRVARSGNLLAVSSLWARRISFLVLEEERLKTLGSCDLDFNPRELCFDPTQRFLLVADAFGGRLALIDPKRRNLLSRRRVEGHNIRSLFFDRQGRAMMSQQILNPMVPTQKQRVFWGTVMGNIIRAVPPGELQPGAAENRAEEWVGRWFLYPLGQPRKAAGDPDAMLQLKDGRIAVCLAGVDEVAVGFPERELNRIRVGRRPSALALSEDQTRLYVANRFEDSISVIDPAAGKLLNTLSLGPLPSLSMRAKGEQLFYDARLSLDGWYSCHSCHTDGHSNGELNDNLGDGRFGSPKRVLSLHGVGSSGPWAWNGKREKLAEQISASISNTMQGQGTSKTAAAIAAYLASLPPPPSLAAARGEQGGPALERGRRSFVRQECGECHRPPAYTRDGAFEVGIEDENGERKFNPPSLRGLSQRQRLLHDGRAADLKDLFSRIGHPEGNRMRGRALDELIIFLNSL